MKAPRWSILVPTVVDRPELFNRLAERLAPQLNDEIEVVVFWNNYERQIGQLRQMLLEEARGTYVNFLDDDDLVTEDYCETILPLLDGVDYIGFMVDFYQNGRHINKPVIHSLKNIGWYEDATGFYRRGVHTNPVKKQIALMGRYDLSDYKDGRPEEIHYANAVDPILKTEHFVNRPLHLYYQTDSHAWDRFVPTDGKYVRPSLPKHFRYHPESTNG